jgi:hypothetical protein
MKTKTKSKVYEKKTTKITPKRSSRVRKQTNKKDTWIDDEENNESLSSAPELDSDDEKKEQNILVDEDAVLNLFNNFSAAEIQSLVSISDIRIKKIISNRPYIDLADLVGNNFEY